MSSTIADDIQNWNIVAYLCCSAFKISRTAKDPSYASSSGRSSWMLAERCSAHHTKRRKSKFSHQRQDSEKKTRMQWNRNFSDNSYLEWEVAERIFHRQRCAEFFHAATLITLLPIKFKLMRWDENQDLQKWLGRLNSHNHKEGSVYIWYRSGHSHLPHNRYVDCCRSSCCWSQSGRQNRCRPHWLARQRCPRRGGRRSSSCRTRHLWKGWMQPTRQEHIPVDVSEEYISGAWFFVVLNFVTV